MADRPDLDGMEHVLNTCKPKLDGTDSKPVLREHVLGARRYCRELFTYCRELEAENKLLRQQLREEQDTAARRHANWLAAAGDCGP